MKNETFELKTKTINSNSNKKTVKTIYSFPDHWVQSICSKATGTKMADRELQCTVGQSHNHEDKYMSG